ncbi:NAD(P)-dependent alcohol dehydrogenase [Paraburkholderia sp. LEh10]|uniref:zinc-dependent alcohol dehydrogenase family protein n=1 Tax=Paraburkholderia sp. LEh10 TaxID=2821353 RepID=UPI001AE77DC1|nr:NAD(P)-dependent alcohol dehydrogenase [Paraburkholderia sp. LEh10]MBP0590433.1 NAD(P)-dependent alcohol dehydrogenase [Paraburkholderia sp. LEh10]
MKRWILQAGATTVDGLIEEAVETPHPGPGQVRVRVSAVSLNFRDHLILSDAHEPWRLNSDLVPAADGAGVVDAVGEGVTKWNVGDRVLTVYLRNFPTWPPNDDIGLGLGSRDEHGVLAEYVVLPEARLTRAPDNLSLAEASTLPCAAVTAWTGLQHAHPVSTGHKVLMLGTGGVSLFAVSLAKALGAEVFVTSSRDDNAARLKALGVERAFNYKTDAEWGKSVFAATGGVNKVINTAGLGSVNQSVQALAYGGDIAVIGLMTFGDAIDPGLFLAKGVSLRGIPVGSREQQEQVVDFIERHDIKPIIHETYHFFDVRAAYEAQLSPSLFGKVVIKVSAE